jgi:hypothetical protein
MRLIKGGEEVLERLIGAGGVAGGVEVHEQAADDRENEGRELRAVDAAQAVGERIEPVGRCGVREIRPQLLDGGRLQLSEHP